MVDGHAICEACGGEIALVAPERWRHGKGRPRAPITLAAMPTYGAFKARFPWAASITEDVWRDGVARLKQYEAALAAALLQEALRPGENPYLALVELLTAPGGSPLLDLAERRRELASLFSWAIPSDAALELIARYGPLVEGGSGMGYWTALLQARGVDTVAYDLRPPGGKQRNAFHRHARKPWTCIQRGSSASAARRHRERALLLCWPPYDDDAASYAALRAYRGDVIIHIGEREGATGSVRFHRELALNWTLVEELELPHWPRLRDSVMVYRRNAQRLPHRERDRCFECRRFIATGAIGRCDACFTRRPPALALRAGRHRVEYPQSMVDAMPAALRKAFEMSPSRIV
jgi:hypothetical protein